MRPTVEIDRDPLRPEKLPPTDGMALRYRIRPGGGHARNWPLFFVSTIIPSLGLVIALQVASRYANTSQWLTFALLVSAACACHRAASRDWADAFIGGPYIFLLTAAAGGIVWLALRFVAQASATPATQLILLAAAVALLAFLADEVATHFVAWRAADPFVDSASRDRILNAWSRRFVDPRPLTTPAIRTSALASLGDLRFSFLLLVAVLSLSVLATLLQASSPFYGLYVCVTLLVLLLVVTGIWTALGQSHPLRTFRIVSQAIASWLSYDPHEQATAGVFQSPAGYYRRRTFLMGGTLFLVVAASAPFSAYFPLVLAYDDPTEWLPVGNKPFFWEPPTTERPPVFSELTPVQKRYAESLPARSRDAYVERARRQNEAAYYENRTRAQLERFYAIPEAWLFTALRGTLEWDSRFYIGLFAELVCSVAYPILLMITVITLVTGRTLRLVTDDLASHPVRDNAITNTWDAYVARLQRSCFPETEYDTDIRERDHLLLGVNAQFRYPVLLHRDILREHAHILGDSGSGKTALGLAPMIAQLTRLSGRLADDTKTKPHEQISIVIIDLKGDRALFQGAKIEAERAGLPFKWFTNFREHATFAFNPFEQPHLKKLTTSQRTEILLQALGLQYGEFYGAGYFSAINQTVLRRYLHKYGKEIASFRDLSERLESPTKYSSTFDDRELQKTRRKDWNDAAHLLARVDMLAALSSLNVTPRLVEEELVGSDVLDCQIDMADVLKRPQVLYFHLSSITETAAVQGIAKLALYALLTAADLVEPGSSAQVYCFIDEFQQIVANNLELVLRQARSKNIACILANQNITDLDSPNGNLMHTVEANTAFKQVFRASSQFQRDRLVAASGESIYHLKSWSTSMTGGSVTRTQSASEQIGPRFRQNDIIDASYEDTQSLVLISKGSGYTQYGGHMFALESDFHIDRDEYTDRTRAPWPNDSRGTFAASKLDAEIAKRSVDQQPAPAAEIPTEHAPTAPPESNNKKSDDQTEQDDRTLFDSIQAFKKGTKP